MLIMSKFLGWNVEVVVCEDVVPINATSNVMPAIHVGHMEAMFLIGYNLLFALDAHPYSTSNQRLLDRSGVLLQRWLATDMSVLGRVCARCVF